MPGAHKTPEGKPSGEMHALGSCLRKLASSRPFPHGELSSPGRKRSHGGRRTTPPHARQFCLAPAQLDKSSLCRRADVTILHIYTMGEPGSAEEPRPMSSGLDLTMAPPTRVSAHPSHHPRPRLSLGRNQQALPKLSLPTSLVTLVGGALLDDLRPKRSAGSRRQAPLHRNVVARDPTFANIL